MRVSRARGFASLPSRLLASGSLGDAAAALSRGDVTAIQARYLAKALQGEVQSRVSRAFCPATGRGAESCRGEQAPQHLRHADDGASSQSCGGERRASGGRADVQLVRRGAHRGEGARCWLQLLVAVLTPHRTTSACGAF